MSRPDRREYAALAAISGSSGMNLLIPLYLSHLGYAVGVVGLLAGLGALTVLLSRIPVPMLYRPQRSRTLLLGAPNPAPRRALSPATAQPTPRGGLHARLRALADSGFCLVLNANTWNQGFQVLQASFLPVLATAVGLGPAQVGIVRAVYSGINMVGRPTAGVFLGRLSLRQVAYLGLAVQSLPLFFLPCWHRLRSSQLAVPLLTSLAEQFCGGWH